MVGFGQPAASSGEGLPRAAAAPACASGFAPPADGPGVHTTTLRELPDAAPARPHRLDHHLLVLVTAGHGVHSVDFVAHPCRPGTLVWARPGQVVRRGRQPGLDAILVGWRSDLLAALDVDAPALTDAFGPTHWQLAGEDEDAVINEVSQLVVDCERQRAGDLPAELLRHQLAVLMLRIAMLPAQGSGHGPGFGAVPDAGGGLGAGQGSGAGPGLGARAGPGLGAGADVGAGSVAGAGPAGASEGDTFLRLRREVERSYVQTRRVEDYAARLGCSVRTLTRACLAATGRSAKQVIDDRSALEARRLLACTDLPIAEIGQRLGFPEPTNFGRFFHREVGCSPGAFRARSTRPDSRVPPPRRPSAVSPPSHQAPAVPPHR
jgi:AraC-like DNA-binding protein